MHTLYAVTQLTLLLLTWASLSWGQVPRVNPHHPLAQGLVQWHIASVLTGGPQWWNLLGPRPLTLLNMAGGSGWQPGTQAGWPGEIRLDGIDDYADGGTDPVFDCTDTTCTYQVRVRTTTAGAGIYILAKRDPNATPGFLGGWFVRVSPTNVVIRITDNLNAPVFERTSTLATANSGAWMTLHVILTTNTSTIAGNAITLYINGQLDTGTPVTGSGGAYSPCTACSFTVGAGHAGVGPLVGAVNDVRLWTRGLSAQEVWAAYQQRPPEFDGLVLQQPLALGIVTPAIKRRILIQ